MSEDRLQLVSLSVLGGPLHGRRYNPEEVVGEVLIGSDSSCHLVLDLPTISPIHAKVWTDLGDSKVLDTSAPRGVYLNNERVEGEARLDEGDVFWLGAPQEPGSICIKCHFKPWVEVLPTVPLESVEAAAEPALETAAFEEADAEEPSPMLQGGAGVDEGLAPTPPPAEPEESLPEESLAAGHVAQEAIADEPAAVEAPAEEQAEPSVEGPAVAEEAAPAWPTASEPEATASQPAADVAAPDEDDPFFVGEAEASVPAGAAAHVAEPQAREEASPAVEQASVEEVVFETAPPEPEPPAEHVPVAMSDDWAITETPAEPEPVPAPTVDEFFVADEPKPAAPLEPAFIEPEPDTGPVFEPMSATPFLDLPPLEPAARRSRRRLVHRLRQHGRLWPPPPLPPQPLRGWQRHPPGRGWRLKLRLLRLPRPRPPPTRRPLPKGRRPPPRRRQPDRVHSLARLVARPEPPRRRGALARRAPRRAVRAGSPAGCGRRVSRAPACW